MGAAMFVTVCGFLGLMWLGAPPAAAQDEGESFRSTIRVEDEAGERVPVEGVELVALDSGGAEISRAASDAEGAVLLPLDGPGTFSVMLDESTLPDGLGLKNPDRGTLPDLDVQAGQSKNVLFALIDGEGGAGGVSLFDEMAQLAVQGLVFGLIIAMSAIGLSLIFGTTGLTNFAHGELVTFGAMVTLLFNDAFGLPVILAAVVGILATAGIGYVNEATLWRPLRRRGTGLIAMLVVSIGLSILVRYVFNYLAGGRRARYDQYAVQVDGYEFGPIFITPRELWIIGISVVVLLIVAIGVQRTKLGKAMRAVADNKDLAESSGIDVERVIMSIWVIGGGLAGLGGVLFGLNQGVRWDMGFELLLLMFAAVTLGGLGTAYGPLVGSVIVGLLINLSTVWVAPELKNIGALLVLVAILLVRPQGIFGRAERVG